MQRFSNPHLAPFLGSVHGKFVPHLQSSQWHICWVSKTCFVMQPYRIHRYVAALSNQSCKRSLLGLISRPHIFSCRLSCDGWPWEHLVVLSTYPPSPPPPSTPRPKFAILGSTLQPPSPAAYHDSTLRFRAPTRDQRRHKINTQNSKQMSDFFFDFSKANVFAQFNFLPHLLSLMEN